MLHNAYYAIQVIDLKFILILFAKYLSTQILCLTGRTHRHHSRFGKPQGNHRELECQLAALVKNTQIRIASKQTMATRTAPDTLQSFAIPESRRSRWS